MDKKETENKQMGEGNGPFLKNRKKKRQWVILMIFFILCIGMTILFTVLKIRKIDQQYKKKEVTENSFEQKEEGNAPKKEEEDKKFICTKEDTYDYNDIQIQNKYDIDGILGTNVNYNYDKYSIGYIETSRTQ